MSLLDSIRRAFTAREAPQGTVGGTVLCLGCSRLGVETWELAPCDDCGGYRHMGCVTPHECPATGRNVKSRPARKPDPPKDDDPHIGIWVG